MDEYEIHADDDIRVVVSTVVGDRVVFILRQEDSPYGGFWIVLSLPINVNPLLRENYEQGLCFITTKMANEYYDYLIDCETFDDFDESPHANTIDFGGRTYSEMISYHRR